jgi:ribosome maturation protein Sdo1
VPPTTHNGDSAAGDNEQPLVRTAVTILGVGAHTRSAKERRQMAERFARDIIRMSLHGTLRPEKYPSSMPGSHISATGSDGFRRKRWATL